MTVHEPGLVQDGDVYQQMTDLLFGSWVSQAVRAVADPSQAKHLAGGGLTAEELVEWLLKDASRSLRPLVMAIANHGHWWPRGEFASAVRRGHAQTNATLGADFFTNPEHHPENAGAQSVIDAVAAHEGGQGPQQKPRGREQTRQPARADQQSTFVLVHGSWHDGSAWANVIKRLQHHGHNAFSPTVAGHGRGVSKQVSQAQAAQSIVDFIIARDLRDVVLVGHSSGGIIISKVVEAIPDRVRRLVYLNAVVLKDGESMEQALPPHYRELFKELAADSPDNTVMLPIEIWQQAFINDADLDLARSTYRQLSPEPYQLIVEPLDLKKFYTLDTPRSFILATDDIALPHGEWGWHPRMTSRLGEHRFLQMPGSHELLLTNPNGLADKIIEAGHG